jgi:hypothetical protein
MARFAEHNSAVAKEWRARVDLPGAWKKAANQTGTHGEAGGLYVELDCVGGRRAYLKPLKKSGHRRAAREKIAFDLAFELGATVPPVVLAENSRSDARERNVAVSLILYPQQFSWGQMKIFLAEPDGEVASTVASRIHADAASAFVLDTWLGQTDHDDHDSNIIFGYEGSEYAEGRFIFLDYAFSMGVTGGWSDEKYLPCHPAAFPKRMLAELRPGEVASALERADSIDEEVVRSIVTRVPDDFLPPAEKETICSGLLARKPKLAEALKSFSTQNKEEVNE